MFGKLSWEAIPLQEPIPLITSVVVIMALGGDRCVDHWIKGVAVSCGTSTSPPPITRRSASCTSSLACSCWSAALPTRS